MRRLHTFLPLLLALILSISASATAGQKYEALSQDNHGNTPSAGLLKASDGAFYGSTDHGGAVGKGTVFKVTPEGVLTTLVSFNDVNGSMPQGVLVEGSDGAFYGTTTWGGSSKLGTIFKVSPGGELTVLVSFNGTNGSNPKAGLIKGSDGAFYGTTNSGGVYGDGTVFKVTPDGDLTTLVSFNGGLQDSGAHSPLGEVIEGSDGNFYGTTTSGGEYRLGTVFKVTPGGVLTILASFNGANGSNPAGGLLEGSDGVFYGTTPRGGASNRGALFKVTAEGELTRLVSFNSTNGYYPSAALIKGSDGNFYGTADEGGANGQGMVFKMTPEGVLTRLVSFSGSNGSNPLCKLVEGSDGALYGTTRFGGVNNFGTVFKVTPEGEFTSLTSLGTGRSHYPEGRLVAGDDGAFYGTTSTGGTSNLGTVFKVTPEGEFATLVSFDGSNGTNPATRLLRGNDGAFYGTTSYGGVNNSGTVFKVTPEGELTTLASLSREGFGLQLGLVEESDGTFYGTIARNLEQTHGTVVKVTPAGELSILAVFDGINGSLPGGVLLKGSDGAVYGTTNGGGANDRGTVFKMTAAGELTVLASFDAVSGYSSNGLVEGPDSAFYGTTRLGGANNLGTVFKVTPAGVLTALVSFDGDNGSTPQGGLVKGPGGAFYGTTTSGGVNGFGTVFKVTPAGELTVLHSFDGLHAASPRCTPVFGTDGQLYGTADQMTVWRISWSTVPSVITNAADAINATEATLRASVIPNGVPTSVWFEYGTSTAYGSTTAVQNVGGGVSAEEANQVLTLLPHTTYHFRVVAQNSEGMVYGEDQSFTTSNRVPTSTADVVSGPYGRSLEIPVLANDSDADGDVLNVVSFTQPSHGEVVRAEHHPNVLVYIPELRFSGVDSFNYAISDGNGDPVLGTVEITVAPRLNPSSITAQNSATPVPGAGEEGSGIPSGATWRIFGVPAINDAGQVAVLGTWKSAVGLGSGIFVDEQLVVKTGDPVPGIASATFKSFQDPVLNGAGRVAFLATIAGAGVKRTSDTVLVSNAFSGELELVAREGDAAPQSGEAKLSKFYNISLQGDSSDNAGLLFTASLQKGSGTPKVTPASDLGAWLYMPSRGTSSQKVVREGDPGFAQGEKIKSFQLLQALKGSPGQPRGHYAAGEVSFTVTLTSKRQALVRFSEGVLEAQDLTRELLGEALAEAKWASLGLPATSTDGEVSAVRATLQNGQGGVTKANATGVFLSSGAGEAYVPVARLGDDAFGVPGAVFSAFSDPLVSGGNIGLVFVGTIKGQGVRTSNNSGIWWQTLNGSSLVARTGTQATEAPEGARWKSFNSLALPQGERGPLFAATLAKGAGSVNANNDQGIWAVDSVGELRLLVRDRDPVGEKTLKSFSALQAVSGAAGVRRSFNNAGQLVYRAYFTDGSQGVVKVQVP